MMPGSPLLDQVGRVLSGRYRLTEAVGAGASGQVFRADDPRLRRQVAVKLLHRSLASDRHYVARFEHEARSAGLLSHRNIVSILDWGEDAGEPYLVMQYLEGGSLRELLDSDPTLRLTPAQVAAAAGGVASALAYAHSRGVLHRDIKPANLLLDLAGNIYVADFGIARALAGTAVTEIAGFVGTGRYAAPEQVGGECTSDEAGRSDVYSLGIVMLEALTGELPFSKDTLQGSVNARRYEDVQIPRDIGPLGPVIAAATAREVKDRLTARELVAELEAAARIMPPPEPLAPAISNSVPSPPDPLDQTRFAIGGSDTTSVDLRTSIPGEAGDPSRTDVLAAAAASVAPSGVIDTTATELDGFASRRGSRRKVWWAAGAVAALLVLAGGGWALERYVLVPVRTVPSLVGMTPAAARARLGRIHLYLAIHGRRYDGRVPLGSIAEQAPFADTHLRQGSVVAVVLSEGPAPRAIPDLSGMTQNAAVASLAAAGFQGSANPVYSETVPSGMVVSWTPQGGLHPVGTAVTVDVSEGPAPRTVPVLSGQTFSAAGTALRALGLVPAEQRIHSATVPVGEVITTNPAPGSHVPRGSTVTVAVSTGPKLVQVPANLFGDSVAQASAALRAVGLSAGGIYGPSRKGPVVYTSPAQGSEVPVGSSVDLYTI